MAISSNARTAADKKALKGIIGTVGKATAEGIDVDFQPDAVIFTMGDRYNRLTREQFETWSESGHPWDGGPVTPTEETVAEAKPTPAPFNPQPKKGKKPNARAKAKAKADPLPDPVEAEHGIDPATRDPEPEPAKPAKKAAAKPKAKDLPRGKPDRRAPRERRSADPAQTADAVASLAARALGIADEKRKGDIGSNAARFRLGELMIQVASVAKASKVPVKTLLAELNQEAVALVSQNQLPDYEPIAESEATATRKVVETFGSSGSFNDVTAINPITGEPLVDDAGAPFERELTEVALNKLYPLAKYADGLEEQELDTLVSFAFHGSEKLVKAVNSAAQKLKTSALPIIRDLAQMRSPQVSPLTGEEVMGKPSERDLIAAVKAMTGDTTSGEEIASLRTARSWYEGTWLPIKATVDAIAQQFIPDAINESTGATSNVFILERVLTQYYHPFDAEGEGLQRILGALVAAGDLTEAKANEFLNKFTFDEEHGWVRIGAAAAAEATDAEADADLADLDEDIFEDEDLDVDDPDEFEDAEGGEDEDDEFDV